MNLAGRRAALQPGADGVPQAPEKIDISGEVGFCHAFREGADDVATALFGGDHRFELLLEPHPFFR